MNKIKMTGLATLMSLYLGVSSCLNNKKVDDKSLAPIDLSIHDLKQNIDTYEGKCIRTSAKILDVNDMMNIPSSSSDFNSTVITLGDVGGNLDEYVLGSYKFKAINESNYKNLQEFQSNINMSIHNGSTLFITGVIHSGVLDYNKITDSRGHVIFENNIIDNTFLFNGKITDINTTMINSTLYLHTISLDTSNEHIKLLSSTSGLESYSKFKNAHVVVKSDKKVWSEIYSLSDIDFDNNYENIENLVSKNTFLKKIDQKSETLIAYMGSFNVLKSKEKIHPSLENVLDMKDLNTLVKYAGIEYKDESKYESNPDKKEIMLQNSKAFNSLAKEISEENTELFINHKAYDLAIESCRNILGDKKAIDLTKTIINKLVDNSELYRAAKLAQGYCNFSTSESLYQKAINELATRGLWNDMMIVSEDAKLSTAKTLEMTDNIRSTISKYLESMPIGTNVVTSSLYLSQTSRDSPLINYSDKDIFGNSDNDILGKIVKLSDNYGRVIVEGLKMTQTDTTKITGEFPIMFLQKTQ
jgi:hypothetical protein